MNFFLVPMIVKNCKYGYTQSWWQYRHLDNIALLHYADMLADPTSAIRRIAGFLDIVLSEQALAAVTQRTNLAAMRQRALADEENSDGPRGFRDGANSFFYKGTNGRWREVLSAAELAMYEETKANVLTPACARWLEQGGAVA
jgi:aryl sulfotransferase